MTLILPRHTDEIRTAHWQGRVLAAARGKTAAVAMSVIAHDIKDTIAFKTLLLATFPGYEGIAPPFLKSCGYITQRGRIVAHIINRDGAEERYSHLYRSEAEMVGEFRKLADELKLADKDRLALFAALKNWIVCDYRLDPNTGEKEKAA